MNRDSNEEWRPIRAWEGLYEVSNHGRVRRSAGSPRTPQARILSPGTWGYGYKHVHFSNAGCTKDYSVHRLVADAFLGPIPDGMQVNHKDGDKTNNRSENLEIVSARENYDHAKKNKFYYRGPRPWQAKLTSEDVYIIRSLKGLAKSSNVAKRFGVHQVTINSLWRRQTWKHLPER